MAKASGNGIPGTFNMVKTTGKQRLTEAAARKQTYAAWMSMKQRCRNPNNPNYASYGGRGITVCERWLNSFSDFLDDVGLRPSESYSLDRIDNDGNYEPSNCRWATYQEQAVNRRRPHNRINFSRMDIDQLLRDAERDGLSLVEYVRHKLGLP